MTGRVSPRSRSASPGARFELLDGQHSRASACIALARHRATSPCLKPAERQMLYNVGRVAYRPRYAVDGPARLTVPLPSCRRQEWPGRCVNSPRPGRHEGSRADMTKLPLRLGAVLGPRTRIRRPAVTVTTNPTPAADARPFRFHPRRPSLAALSRPLAIGSPGKDQEGR